MSAIKIDRKIAKFRVQKPADQAAVAAEAEARTVEAKARDTKGKVVRLTEEVQRPEVLIGSTYKIKTPVSDHAMYVTINDIILNEGSEHEQRRPFEVFINSKNLDHYQWIVALTRIISAVFRKGGDVTFLVDELKAVFDPRGGYFKSGGVYMPSVVAELGAVIEDHMKRIGLILPDDPAEREALKKKKQALRDAMKNREVQLVINTTEGKQSLQDSFSLRRTALMMKIPYYTTTAGALAAAQAIGAIKAGELDVRPIQDYAH